MIKQNESETEELGLDSPELNSLGTEEPEQEQPEPIPQTTAPLQDSREYFVLETPDGYKLAVGSSVINAVQLRDEIINTYVWLLDRRNNHKPTNGGSSYYG